MPSVVNQTQVLIKNVVHIIISSSPSWCTVRIEPSMIEIELSLIELEFIPFSTDEQQSIYRLLW